MSESSIRTFWHLQSWYLFFLKSILFRRSRQAVANAKVLNLTLMYIGGLKRKSHVFSTVILIVFCTWLAPVAAAEKSLVDSKVDSVLTGNRFLIITPDADSGNILREILQELYGAEVVIKTIDDYTPFIDESAFDAFVYHSSLYSQLPAQSFIDDMERTSKPVLWINYHGWALNKKYLGAKGITIHDQHDDSYTEIEMQEVFALSSTDTTLMESKPENIIYSLRAPSGKKIPGAVHTENYTFVAYSPKLDIFAPDFQPFLMAIRAAFEYTPAPAPVKKISLNYQERILAGRKDAFRTGVHLPVYVASSQGSRLGYENDKWHENLLRIKQSGAEWVNLVRTFYQTDAHSADIQADEKRTPRLDTLENIIHDAHELGLMVQIHLAMNLKMRKPNDWHGMISPDNRQQWWTAYQALVLEMAEFSRRNEVEALIIGTEYISMEPDEKNWRALIGKVREQAQFSGMLGYGANYSSLDISWLDELDFFGISAYWPLSEHRDPDLQTLNKSWSLINKKLGSWRGKHPSLRVEFTEVGYASQPYASVLPFSWKPHKGKAQNFTEQLQCYRSLLKFLEREPKIKGVHIFASTAADDDPDSIGYTPFGKPAERVVKQIMQIR